MTNYDCGTARPSGFGVALDNPLTSARMFGLSSRRMPSRSLSYIAAIGSPVWLRRTQRMTKQCCEVSRNSGKHLGGRRPWTMLRKTSAHNINGTLEIDVGRDEVVHRRTEKQINAPLHHRSGPPGSNRFVPRGTAEIRCEPTASASAPCAYCYFDRRHARQGEKQNRRASEWCLKPSTRHHAKTRAPFPSTNCLIVIGNRPSAN